MSSPSRFPVGAVVAAVVLGLAAGMFVAAVLAIPQAISLFGPLALGGTVLTTIGSAVLIHVVRQRALRRRSGDGSFELPVNAGPAFTAHLAEVSVTVPDARREPARGRDARLRATATGLVVDLGRGGAVSFPRTAIRGVATFSVEAPTGAPAGAVPITGIAVDLDAAGGGSIRLRIPVVDRAGRRYHAADLEAAVATLTATLALGEDV